MQSTLEMLYWRFLWVLLAPQMTEALLTITICKLSETLRGYMHVFYRKLHGNPRPSWPSWLKRTPPHQHQLPPPPFLGLYISAATAHVSKLNGDGLFAVAVLTKLTDQGVINWNCAKRSMYRPKKPVAHTSRSLAAKKPAVNPAHVAIWDVCT